MIKKNKWKLVLTSVLILLPVAVGLILWNRLPEQMATHWNAEGEADGFSHKAVGVFVLPLFMLAVHWLCTVVTAADPKNRNISGKPLGLVLWICPVMSLLCSSLIYATALGMDISMELIMPMAMGVMFIVIGNYLPKCRQNYSLGIKLPWTLHDEENWNRTHRFAGPVWITGGLVILTTAFLKSPWIFVGILVVIAVLPTIYSYVHYRKNKG